MGILIGIESIVKYPIFYFKMCSIAQIVRCHYRFKILGSLYFQGPIDFDLLLGSQIFLIYQSDPKHLIQ